MAAENISSNLEFARLQLRAAMAKSEDARRDNEGQQIYWARQAFIVAASANGLLGRLN